MPYQPFRLKRARNKKFFMVAVSRNGNQIWRTPGEYERRAGAFKATHAGAKIFGGKWDGTYKDLTNEPVKLNIKKPK